MCVFHMAALFQESCLSTGALLRRYTFDVCIYMARMRGASLLSFHCHSFLCSGLHGTAFGCLGQFRMSLSGESHSDYIKQATWIFWSSVRSTDLNFRCPKKPGS